MRVVIAPDSFKGSIGAGDAAAALADGWLAARPHDEVACLPLADGGEGTLEVLAATVSGARWHTARVTGPDGDPVTSPWLELPGRAAVVELARCSGLPLLRSPDPLGAHTTGLGEVIGHAIDGGARSVLIALGGSASTDGGAGALAALGARFLDAAGHRLAPGGGALAGLASVDTAGLRPLPVGAAACLADVRSPLLGPTGAAAMFGPQKGAGPAEIALLERGLARLAEALGGEPGAAGAGAAGGTGYGLAAAWGAVIKPGALELCRLAGLDRLLAAADLVVTGEGRYDQTSVAGKVAGTVLAAAAEHGVPAAVVAGQIDYPVPGPAVTLAGLAGGPEQAMAKPGRWLRDAGRDLAARCGGAG